MTPEKPESNCKVTMQYRRGAGKVFELESAGKILDVHVTPHEGSDSAEHWRVAVQDRRTADAIVISETGSTPGEALEKVGHSWVEQMTERKLTAFDWIAIASTLRAVRAI